MDPAANRFMHIMFVALQLAVVEPARLRTSGCPEVLSLLNDDQAEHLSQTAFDYVIVGQSNRAHPAVGIADDLHKRWNRRRCDGFPVREVISVVANSEDRPILYRLAENPNIQVGVIEVGASHLDGSMVSTPGV